MTLRYEKKYLVSNDLLSALRERVSPFLVPDLFAQNSGYDLPEYTVRSIYLDSPDKDSVFEKKEGFEIRKKLRIRGYNHQHEFNEVFLEIKRKYGNRIAKNRAIVPFSKLPQILEYGLDQKTEKKLKKKHMLDDAYRFLYQMKKNLQQPLNLIVYDREPFFGLFDKSVRITFDKNIRSKLYPELSELFTDLDLVFIWLQHFILEVKYLEPPMPVWIKSIISEFKLESAALSKYAEGYFCHDIHNINLLHKS